MHNVFLWINVSGTRDNHLSWVFTTCHEKEDEMHKSVWYQVKETLVAGMLDLRDAIYLKPVLAEGVLSFRVCCTDF